MCVSEAHFPIFKCFLHTCKKDCADSGFGLGSGSAKD